ncbi:MAG: hypothetical protein HOP31_12900 [Ignavibacteria bacterium]|nr:hypothetical protein [Ignavibacteria bacterium]
MIIKNSENINITKRSFALLENISKHRNAHKLISEKGGVIIGKRIQSRTLNITGRHNIQDDYTSFINIPNLSNNPSLYVSNDNLIVWYTEKLLRKNKILAYYHFHLSNNPEPSPSDIKSMKMNAQKLKRDLLMFIFADNENNSVTNFQYRA